MRSKNMTNGSLVVFMYNILARRGSLSNKTNYTRKSVEFLNTTSFSTQLALLLRNNQSRVPPLHRLQVVVPQYICLLIMPFDDFPHIFKRQNAVLQSVPRAAIERHPAEAVAELRICIIYHVQRNKIQPEPARLPSHEFRFLLQPRLSAMA